MKPLVACVIPLSFFACLLPISHAQEVYSEVPFVTENGILKCKRVVVSFYHNVISTGPGVRLVDTTAYPIRDPLVKITLEQLAREYGSFTIRKTIPRLTWGDTVVVNRRTGASTPVPDMSQNFAVDFEEYIPIDSVIAVLQLISGVRYAERPIAVSPLVTPNDPHYTNGDQWHLNRIGAPDAWDITTGSSSVRGAMIDIRGGFVISTHEDFQLAGGGNKFVGGDGETGAPHASWTAGVVGATTNNGIGVAGVGWNTSLLAWIIHETTG